MSYDPAEDRIERIRRLALETGAVMRAVAPETTAGDEDGASSSGPQPDADGNYDIRIVLAVEGQETSDGRMIEAGALSHRTLPLSIAGMTRTSEGGHLGAVVCGRLDQCERVPGPQVRSRKTGEPFPEGVFVWRGIGKLFGPRRDGEPLDLVLRGGLTGNSVDLTEASADVDYEPMDPDAASDMPSPIEGGRTSMPAPPKMIFTRAVIGMTTLCPVPAFEDAYVELGGPDGWEVIEPGTGTLTAVGWSDENLEEAADLVAAAASPCGGELEPQGPVDAEPTEEVTLVASGALEVPAVPPAAWFEDPRLEAYTPLTVHDDGRVTGHVADWAGCHTGFADRCVPPPRSFTDYALYQVGPGIRALDADGRRTRVKCGPLTLGGGHADKRLGVRAAVAHYDDVGTVVADLAVGEDSFGIWAAGALRPGLDDAQLRQVDGARPSGDWRKWRGNRELLAVHCVVTPGFPIVASAIEDGEVESLVAAGEPIRFAQTSDGDTPRPSAAVMLDYDLLAERIAERIGLPFLHPDYGVESDAEAVTAGAVIDLGALFGGEEPGKDGPPSCARCGKPATGKVTRKSDKPDVPVCDAHTSKVVRHIGDDVARVIKAKADDSGAGSGPDTAHAAGTLEERALTARRAAALEDDPDLAAALEDAELEVFAEGLAEIAWTPDEPGTFADLLEGLEYLDADDRAALTLLEAEEVELASGGKGKGGKRGNWVSQVGGLPKLIRRVADHIIAKGKTESNAIAIAVNVVKRYCRNPADGLNFPGAQKVKAETKAKGCAAVASWDEKRARAKAS
jgi:hypothetical protein